jgi:hypothetical protein
MYLVGTSIAKCMQVLALFNCEPLTLISNKKLLTEAGTVAGVIVKLE